MFLIGSRHLLPDNAHFIIFASFLFILLFYFYFLLGICCKLTLTFWVSRTIVVLSGCRLCVCVCCWGYYQYILQTVKSRNDNFNYCSFQYLFMQYSVVQGRELGNSVLFQLTLMSAFMERYSYSYTIICFIYVHHIKVYIYLFLYIYLYHLQKNELLSTILRQEQLLLRKIQSILTK